MVDRYNIISVSVRNFMSIDHAEILFTDVNQKPRKLVTITGHQGGGKSSIIFSIQWCAYGTARGSRSRRFSRTSLYPGWWSGNQKHDISVVMRLRPVGENHNPRNDIYCKRVLRCNEEQDSLEVTIADEHYNQIDSSSYFRQIFGKPPQIEEGAMWVIRQEEMARMASTISSNKESYFLDFMNLEVPFSALTDLHNINQKTIDRVGRKNWMPGHTLPHIEAELRELKDKIRNKTDAYNALALKVKETKPTPSEEELLQAAELFEKAEKREREAENKLNTLRLRKDEIPDLMNTLLSGKLLSKGIEIERSYSASKFDWIEIAKYLERTRKFIPEVTDEIRELGLSTGYDTTGLINASEQSKKWQKKMHNLKDALVEHINSRADVRKFNDAGITTKSVETTRSKDRTFREDYSRFDKLGKDLEIWADDAKGLQDEINKIKIANTKKAKDKDQLVKLEKQNKVITGLMDSIDNANHIYRTRMFEQTIERVKYFWNQIDQMKEYIPVLINEPIQQFALRNILDGSVRRVKIDSSSGNASGGESQLLLICTCLAVSESSGAKMPIVLDDCFTDVDEDTVKVLLKVVSNHFDSLIFVTNYKAKAELIRKESDGTLNISRHGLNGNISEATHREWAVWSE